MALIEIDGLPFLKMGGDFPWQTVSHNQMVTWFLTNKNAGENMSLTNLDGLWQTLIDFDFCWLVLTWDCFSHQKWWWKHDPTIVGIWCDLLGCQCHGMFMFFTPPRNHKVKFSRGWNHIHRGPFVIRAGFIWTEDGILQSFTMVDAAAQATVSALVS